MSQHAKSAQNAMSHFVELVNVTSYTQHATIANS